MNETEKSPHIVFNLDNIARQGTQGIGAFLMLHLQKFPLIRENTELQKEIEKRFYNVLADTEASLQKQFAEKAEKVASPILNHESENEAITGQKENETKSPESSLKVGWNAPESSLKVGGKSAVKSAESSLSKPSNSYYYTLLKTLVGNQKILMKHFFDECRKNDTLLIEKVRDENLSFSTGIKVDSIKWSLDRLQEVGLIIRNTGKFGRGGWKNYELPNEVFSALNLINLESEKSAVKSAEPPLGVVVGELYKTPPKVPLALDPDCPIWKLDLSEGIGYGFQAEHLPQIVKAYTTGGCDFSLSQVQSSFNQICHDVKTMGKINSPAGLLLARLREGLLYATSSIKFNTPEAIRKFSSQQEQEKIQQQIVKKENEKYERNVDGLRNWIHSLSEEEKKEIIGNLKGPAVMAQYAITYADRESKGLIDD